MGGVVSWDGIGNGEMGGWYHCEVWDELISSRDSLAVELMRNVEGLRRCSWCVRRDVELKLYEAVEMMQAESKSRLGGGTKFLQNLHRPRLVGV